MENEDAEELEQLIRIIKLIDENVRLKKIVLTPLQEVHLTQAKIVINRIQSNTDTTNTIGIIHLN